MGNIEASLLTDITSVESSAYADILAGKKKTFDAYWNRSVPPCMPRASLRDFQVLGPLNDGTFGTVYLVKHFWVNRHFALKVMNKQFLVKSKQVEHIVNEKRIQQGIVWPFIVPIEYSFKDATNVYIGMEYMAGGELFSYLEEHGPINESEAKFYAAQVALAFEYLHYLNIVYRDLKPENILICRRGFIKLTDFSFAKKLNGRTWTFCGTPEYMAPEIILSKGTGLPSDWWSWGVLVYELVAGFPPFRASKPVELYERITAGKFKCPRHFSHNLRQLVKSVLQVDVTKRMGRLKNGFNDIKMHPWFRDVLWLDLYNKRMTPPFVPKCEHSGDMLYFHAQNLNDLKVENGDDKFAKEFEDF